MTTGAGPDDPFTLVFIGHTTAMLADRAAAYEDAVLALLADHGARVVYRGRRLEHADPALPFEVHLLWFPTRGAFDDYMADERRAALLDDFGDVFTAKQVVEMQTIVG
jgi:hypothetical protein